MPFSLINNVGPKLSIRAQLPYQTACRVLQELLSQVGHYSERIRKDALSGLSQLLSAHPQVLRSQVLCLQKWHLCSA